jgi:hypothetical protein
MSAPHLIVSGERGHKLEAGETYRGEGTSWRDPINLPMNTETVVSRSFCG